MDYETIKKKKEDVGWNINKGWDFVKTPKLSKKELLKERAISKRLKEINYENIRGDFSLTYNEDYNVELFTNAISERIAALNWGLKKEYFFFGLKKEDIGFLAANLKENKFFSVPSNRSKEKTLDTLTRMRDRFMDFRGTSIRIDPKTGKTIGGKREYIMIGIPYDLRVDKNIKPLISLIYDIEQEKIVPKKYEDLPEISDKDQQRPPEEDPSLQELRDIQTINPNDIARNAFRGSDGTELNEN
jgi:bifunctional DNA-binding transcriptional regulator/antitoxin component of YhaV-PrlF toxin-antitoxin module